MNTEYMDVAVAGLHLTGQPLNHQLITLGGQFVKACRTAARYKMYLIEDDRGMKPGLVRMPNGKPGGSYAVEVWSLPIENIGKLLSFIPGPLGLGTVDLDDETTVKGFICEHRAVEEGQDISDFPGWMVFLESLE